MMSFRFLLLPTILAGILLGQAGCGGQKTNGADAAGVNQTVTISPSSTTVTVGQTTTFQAFSSLGSGWSWKVVPASLGTFSGNGVFLAKQAGTGIVVATWTADNRYQGTTTLTVDSAPLATITSASTVNEAATGLTASVPEQAGCTYAWSISGGTITAGGDARQLTFAAGTVGTVELTCVVTNSAGASVTAHFTVTVVAPPLITRFEGLPSLVQTGGIAQLWVGFQNGSQAVVTPGNLTASDGGLIPVTLGQATQFTLTVSNAAGVSVQATTTVLVGDSCPPASPSPGDVWTDLATGLDMVYCPPGSFQMGAGNGDSDATGNEAPTHSVTLPTGFWISRSKVTQAQWMAQLGTNPSFFSSLTACATFGELPQRPVEQVSWEDLQAFLDRINAKLGWKLYRLPSEAEWEFAYRGGTSTRYYWGDDASASGAIQSAYYLPTATLKTWAVGPASAHPWGLYDMVGNAMEWVADDYQPDFLSAPVGGRATLGLNTGYRTVRGSSWNDAASCLRASARFVRPQSERARTLGFRVIRPACSVPVLRAFKASPAGPLPAGGGQVTLSWELSGATRVWIDQGVGEVTGSTSTVVTVGASGTFVLVAENADGWVMATAKVEVAS